MDITPNRSESRSRTADQPWNIEGSMIGPGTFDDGSAARYCKSLAEGHYENFPVFLPLFKPAQREALAAIYTFARTADDFADEPCFDGLRGRLLDGWESQLRKCFDGNSSHPAFIALARSRQEFDLPLEPFLNLLDAFRQDCRVKQYETFDDLLDYCRRSANPVGRLVLRVMGIHSDETVRWSDSICTALQLINFWQDLSVDIPRDRLYLPLEDLNRFELRSDRLTDRQYRKKTAALMEFEIGRTKDILTAGKPLVHHAPYPSKIYFAGVYTGGMAVLRMTSMLGPEAMVRRPSLRIRDLLGMAVYMSREKLRGMIQ